MFWECSPGSAAGFVVVPMTQVGSELPWAAGIRPRISEMALALAAVFQLLSMTWKTAVILLRRERI